MCACRARQDVILPLSEPIKGVNGKLIHEIMIPKDTTIVIGILSANRNRAIWGEDATKWKPERWLSPLPDAVIEARIPGIYSNLCVAYLSPRNSVITSFRYRMTFLGGGRACMYVIPESYWHLHSQD